MRRRFFTSLTVVLFAFGDPGWAVMHLHPELYPHAAKDQIHHPSAAQIHRAGSLRAAITGGSTGTHEIAVVLVQFQASQAGLTSGLNTISNAIANTITANCNKMTQFYSQASYGTLTLHFTYFGNNGARTTAASAGVISLNHPQEYYGCGDEGGFCPGVTLPPGTVSPNANGDVLIRDALAASDPSLVSTAYDAVIVVHAGNGNETSSSNGDIWSIFYSQISAGRGFTEGDVVPATESQSLSPLGVMCHEFGHSLGLPDLYNTTSGTSVVGRWELMDYGPYDGAGSNPAFPSAWDKISLGWITPTVVTSSNAVVSLQDVETHPDAVEFPVQGGLAGEYFLAEYRLQNAASYDNFIPGSGLLIWHVDGNLASTRGINATDPNYANTVNALFLADHYGVSIKTADSVTISNNNLGDAANAFTDGKNFVNPLSDGFNGQPSGVNLVNVAGVGSPTVTADATDLPVGASQGIVKVITYPNPAGPKYPPGSATFQFLLTRPANDYSINIYTLSGDLVRKVSQAEIHLAVADKWKYEFQWDLTNGDGSKVAPGVYFYVVRADGLSEKGKMVVIR